MSSLQETAAVQDSFLKFRIQVLTGHPFSQNDWHSHIALSFNFMAVSREELRANITPDLRDYLLYLMWVVQGKAVDCPQACRETLEAKARQSSEPSEIDKPSTTSLNQALPNEQEFFQSPEVTVLAPLDDQSDGFPPPVSPDSLPSPVSEHITELPAEGVAGPSLLNRKGQSRGLEKPKSIANTLSQPCT